MKDQILKLITEKPKHFAKMIKSNQALHDWVMQSTLLTPDTNFVEHIWSAVNQATNLCSKGNLKKFSSINTGYRFCGTAAHCDCAKESVSAKVSDAKSNQTSEQINQSNLKRIATCQAKYGVTNAANLPESVAKHREFYSDRSMVEATIIKAKQTKLEKYGDANFNNASKIKDTYKQKRTDGFWVNRYPDKNIAALEDYDQMFDLYSRLQPQQIADELKVHIQTVYRYLNQHKIRVPYQSDEERQVVQYLESLGITNIVRNTRSLLPSRKEIDIYLPDYKIAIEYNGVYWHHEDVAHITKDYHSKKFYECESLGIQLITIFSTFWLSKPHIVKQILAAKLGLISNSVYARKCSVIEVGSERLKDFLNKYHVQGYTASSIAYGLVFGTELVAVMTFSKSRIAMGIKSDDTELVRFASSCSVPGAASKLLKHYLKNHPDETIISYSDNEWSNGRLYKTLGFELAKEVPPSYWYISPKANKLFHRFTFSKQKLIAKGYDACMTESEITKDMGLLKLWDCGKRKWVLKSC